MRRVHVILMTCFFFSCFCLNRVGCFPAKYLAIAGLNFKNMFFCILHL